jgi:nitrilase
MAKIAVIQESSVLLNQRKTVEKALQFIDKAVAAGAELVVFPEAYIPGYPIWIWRLRPGVGVE